MGQRWTSDLSLGGTGPETRTSARAKGGGRAAEGDANQQDHNSWASRPHPNKAACARGPRTRPGSQAAKPPPLREEGLRAAPAPQSALRGFRASPGRPRSEAGGRGTTGLASARRAEPGSGARWRGARSRLRTTRAAGPPRASGARAPVGPGERRVGGRSRHPGLDRAQETKRGGPAEGGSERASVRATQRADGRQPLAPEGPSEVGAAGPARSSGPAEGGRGAGPGGAPRPGRPDARQGRAAPPPSLPGPGGRARGPRRWVRGATGGEGWGRARGVVRRLRRAGRGRGQRPCVRVCRGGLPSAPSHLRVAVRNSARRLLAFLPFSKGEKGVCDS